MDSLIRSGLHKDIVDACGFSTPTDIQAKAIPLMIEGKDVVGQSATGSGKTFAFGAGILQRIATSASEVQAVVLVPTRELALQVTKEFARFGKRLGANVATLYGGVGMQPQIDALRKAQIVVATPGRLLDFINQKLIDLSNVRVAVLDEADIMFDMGFIHDVSDILSYTPKDRQTLLFSATFDDNIHHIMRRFMRNPTIVKVDEHVDVDLLHQAYLVMQPQEKFSVLLHLIQTEQPDLALVFCNTRRTTDLVAANLKKQGVKATPIHGGLTQARRTHIVDAVKKGKLRILVCTDVAARGLHIDGVTHVFNYNAPNDPRQYMHRIGRTARAGARGMAFSLIARPDYENFGRVERLVPFKIQEEPLPSFKKVSMHTGKDNPRRPRQFNRRRLRR